MFFLLWTKMSSVGQTLIKSFFCAIYIYKREVSVCLSVCLFVCSDLEPKLLEGFQPNLAWATPWYLWVTSKYFFLGWPPPKGGYNFGKTSKKSKLPHMAQDGAVFFCGTFCANFWFFLAGKFRYFFNGPSGARPANGCEAARNQLVSPKIKAIFFSPLYTGNRSPPSSPPPPPPSTTTPPPPPPPSDPCSPSPCLNGGECIQLRFGRFRCECAGTDYFGESCENGEWGITIFFVCYVQLGAYITEYNGQGNQYTVRIMRFFRPSVCDESLTLQSDLEHAEVAGCNVSAGLEFRRVFAPGMH